MLLNVFAKKVAVTQCDLPSAFLWTCQDRRWRHWLLRQYNVVVYRDPACATQMGKYLFDHPCKPTRRNRYVTINGYRWRLHWV